jgi:hypothetical protein
MVQSHCRTTLLYAGSCRPSVVIVAPLVLCRST